LFFNSASLVRSSLKKFYRKNFTFIGAFSDIDRNFLSEHAAIGLETQQLQVSFFENLLIDDRLKIL